MARVTLAKISEYLVAKGGEYATLTDHKTAIAKLEALADIHHWIVEQIREEEAVDGEIHRPN